MPDVFSYDHARTSRGGGKVDGALHEITALNLAAQTLAALKCAAVVCEEGLFARPRSSRSRTNGITLFAKGGTHAPGTHHAVADAAPAGLTIAIQ